MTSKPRKRPAKKAAKTAVLAPKPVKAIIIDGNRRIPKKEGK